MFLNCVTLPTPHSTPVQAYLVVGGNDLDSTELLIFGDRDLEWKEVGPLPHRTYDLSATTVANTVYASGEYNLDSDGIQ